MPPLSSSAQSSSPSLSVIVLRRLVLFLATLVFIQFLIISFLLSQQQQQQQQQQKSNKAAKLLHNDTLLQVLKETKSDYSKVAATSKESNNNNDKIIQNANQVQQEQKNNNHALDELEGVAVTVMLRAPKWFHRRYNAMIHNLLSQLPNDKWALQIIVNWEWFERDVLPYHFGLQRLLLHNNNITHSTTKLLSSSSSSTIMTNHNNQKIIITKIPNNMTKLAPKKLLKTTWFWESIVHNQVFLFSGNGALCSHYDTNKIPSWDIFYKYDYIGVPTNRLQGIGGDGSTHSFRHVNTMLEIIIQNSNTQSSSNNDDDPEWQFFVKQMIRDQEKYKIASPEMTKIFGSVEQKQLQDPKEIKAAPFVVSGTQSQLTWSEREALLMICPELKVIFPTLHEPSCFGAHPNAEQCKATICALQEPRKPGGC